MGDVLVSVVLPAYNCEETIEEAVQSILDQSYSHFELLVVDDKSEDRTFEILTRLAAEEDRLRVFRSEGKGISDALNLGLRHAKGAYFARMDGDDISMPKRLEKQVEYLENNPEVVLLGARAQGFYHQPGDGFDFCYSLGDVSLKSEVLYKPPFCHPSLIARMEVIKAIGGYRKQFDGAEDHDLYLRLYNQGLWANLDEALIYYRLHPGQSTQMKRGEGMIASFAALASFYDVRAGKVDPVDGQQTNKQIVTNFLDRFAARDQWNSKDMGLLVWAYKQMLLAGFSFGYLTKVVLKVVGKLLLKFRVDLVLVLTFQFIVNALQAVKSRFIRRKIPKSS